MIKDLIDWGCFLISVGCLLIIIANTWQPKHREYVGRHRMEGF